MKRLRQISLASLVVVIALIAARYVRHQRDRQLALPVIAEVGGKIGSIPVEPFGTDYYISFRDRSLTRRDVERLVAIEPLCSRNNVLINLEHANISPDDFRRLNQILPSAHFRNPIGHKEN